MAEDIIQLRLVSINFLVAEAELLEIFIEIDKAKIYEEFGLTHLTPYCVKHLGLSQDVATAFP